MIERLQDWKRTAETDLRLWDAACAHLSQENTRGVDRTFLTEKCSAERDEIGLDF